MSLDDTLAAEPAARSQDVSKVARSGRGFMRAYESAGGQPARMGNESTSGQPWTKRRTNFIKRHSAQLDQAWENGEPTRRHLALMMWAYTPTPQRTRQWLRRKGSGARPQIHAMKLPAWTLRLQRGTKQLERATKKGNVEHIIAGLEDVSFWVGRSVGDAFGAAGQGGATEPQLRRAGDAIIKAETAIFAAHEKLRGSRNLLQDVQGALTPELLHPDHGGGVGPLAGHCYVATQSLWHLLGAQDSGYTPHSGPAPGGGTHWWLVEDDTGRVIDPTATQFPAYDYSLGSGKGFLTRDPSRRARIVIERVRRNQ